MLRLPVPHCPLGAGLPRGRGSFKLPKREAGCPHPRREGLGTWRPGRTRTFLHLGRAEARTRTGTHTRGHTQRHALEAPCAHVSTAPHTRLKVQMHTQMCRHTETPANMHRCSHLHVSIHVEETDAPVQPGTHTHTHTHTHTRVNPEVEETQARPASHRCTAQQAWLRKDHTGPGRCTASSPRPSVPPLLPSWNAGMGQVRRVSGLQKAKDPGLDTHGSCTSSCVPPGSGSVAPQGVCKRRAAHSPGSRQRNPWR